MFGRRICLLLLPFSNAFLPSSRLTQCKSCNSNAYRISARDIMMASIGESGTNAAGKKRVLSKKETEALLKVDKGAPLGEVDLKQVIIDIEAAAAEEEARRIIEEEQAMEFERMKNELRDKSRPNKVRDPVANNRRQARAGGGAKLPLPLFDLESIGLSGRWEEVGGNFLLRPPEGVEVKAVLHFLGGAFVGAAPHITYGYLLNGLAEEGFVVVATPYPIGFDYLEVCDGILERFEQAALPLAQQYGPLPVIGIGHSLGALLQLLITCLFPDTPRAANALLSFNNKPAKQAVPGFEELVIPLVSALLAEGSPQLQIAEALWASRINFANIVEDIAASPLAPLAVEKELIPLARQALELVEQVPPLLRQLADGAREFTPNPEETKEVVKRMYRARRTLVVRFNNDSLDESEDVREIIQAGKTLLRMRRPMVDMELRYETLKGSHITPLAQDLYIPPPIASNVNNCAASKAARKSLLATVNELGQLLVEWIEEGISAASSYNPQ